MLTLGKQGLGSLRKTQIWKDLCDEFFKGVPALGEVQAPSVMSPMASTRGWCHQTHTTVSFSATGANTCVCEREREDKDSLNKPGELSSTELPSRSWPMGSLCLCFPGIMKRIDTQPCI